MKLLDKENWPAAAILILLGACVASILKNRPKFFRRISDADLHEIVELVLDPAWEDEPHPPAE